jgi:predicted RNA-binding Zn ribbon-like protein
MLYWCSITWNAMSKESKKFRVPDELANLYDFANSLDLRCFTHNRVQHAQGDELTGAAELAAWMSARKLSKPGTKITAPMFETALALRSSLRDYLACDAAGRRNSKEVLRSLSKAMQHFPLVTEADDGGRMTLRAARSDALGGLSPIVAEFYTGSKNGTLDRLKMCASDECHRVFFDRSKPGSRRWCVSTLCGNRMKTRTYRERHQDAG